MTGPVLAALLGFSIPSPLLSQVAPPVGSGGAQTGVQDSPGVRIVDVRAEELRQLPRWRVADTPLVSIGELEADEPYMFGGISHAIRLESGEIVIADSQWDQIRLFDAEGRFIRLIGSHGEGPGEFYTVDDLREMADSGIGVLDNSVRRLTVFNVDGSLRSTTPQPCTSGGAPPPDGIPPPCRAEGVTGDGTILSTVSVRKRAEDRNQAFTVMENPDRLFHHAGGHVVLALTRDQTMRVVDSIADAANASMLDSSYGEGGFWWSSEGIVAPRGQWALGPERLVYGWGATYEIRSRDGMGRLVQILRVESAPAPITDAVVDSILGLVATGPEPHRVGSTKYLNELAREGTLPPHGELMIDDAGRLWVSRKVVPGIMSPEPEQVWTVFDPFGVPLATIETTVPSHDILNIDEDTILLRIRDELGVHRAELRRIVRRPPAP